MKTILRPEHRDELKQLYSQKNRHYHDLEHIAILFQLASAHGVRLSIPQQLAIWYHDCIYDATRNDNEQLSCALLVKHHEDNVALNRGYVNRAINIIMDTKTHVGSDYESLAVIDLDLVGLGFDTASYKYATQQIRKEYMHLSDSEWRLGRIAFLNNLLKGEYIFYTNWARDFYEKQARRNIEQELATL